MDTTPIDPKLLVVGWDGATFDLLDPWIECLLVPHGNPAFSGQHRTDGTQNNSEIHSYGAMLDVI